MVDTGRPPAHHSENADWHGRLRQNRFQVPRTWPQAPDPYDPYRWQELGGAEWAALRAWIQANVEPSSAPAIQERHVIERSGLKVSPGAIRGALNDAGYQSPLRDMDNAGAFRYYAKISN